MGKQYVQSVKPRPVLSLNTKPADDSEDSREVRFSEAVSTAAPVTPARLTNAITVVGGHVGQQSAHAMSASQMDRGGHAKSAHKWVESVDRFGELVDNVWRAMDREGRIDPSRGVTVALIDDGVDSTSPALQGRILPGRTFSYMDESRMRSWYTSEKGHGTVMASSIARVCPMAKIYPLRLNTTGSKSWKSSIDSRSAAEVIHNRLLYYVAVE